MVKCRICNKEYHAISSTHLKTHGLTFKEYIERFPDAPTTWNKGRIATPEELSERELKRKIWLQEYRQKNKERIRKQRKKHRDKPEAKAKRREYNQRPLVKERAKQRAIRYREENGDEYRAYHAQWQRRKKWGKVADKVMSRDNTRCQKCGGTERLAIHHIDWDDKNNNLENLIALCNSCHTKVHMYIPEELRKPIFDRWMKEEDTVN